MDVGSRIKQRRKQLKMSVDRLAEVIGKNRATIYRYESGDIENMPIEALEPIAKALNVSPAYLMGWEDEKEEIMSEYTFIPASISAGDPIDVESINASDTSLIKIPDSLMGKWAGQSDIYMMRINGESMNKIIPHGSVIGVKQMDPCNISDGDIVLYSEDNGYSVKRLYKRNGYFVFRPDSKDDNFIDNVIPADSPALKIHGKVVMYIIEMA